jgi:hypothetical protein
MTAFVVERHIQPALQNAAFVPVGLTVAGYANVSGGHGLTVGPGLKIILPAEQHDKSRWRKLATYSPRIPPTTLLSFPQKLSLAFTKEKFECDSLWHCKPTAKPSAALHCVTA